MALAGEFRFCPDSGQWAHEHFLSEGWVRCHAPASRGRDESFLTPCTWRFGKSTAPEALDEEVCNCSGKIRVGVPPQPSMQSTGCAAKGYTRSQGNFTVWRRTRWSTRLANPDCPSCVPQQHWIESHPVGETTCFVFHRHNPTVGESMPHTLCELASSTS